MENEPRSKNDEEILNRLNSLMHPETPFVYKPESYPDLIKQFTFLKEQLNLEKDLIIYHPCCLTDVSLSAVFPNARIIYVDLEEEAVSALQAAGYEAQVADATEYNPGEVDLVVLLNPQIPSAKPISHVKVGGYVFVNDWHGNAEEILKDNNYTCQGFVKEDENGLILAPINKNDHREGAHSVSFYVFEKLS